MIFPDFVLNQAVAFQPAAPTPMPGVELDLRVEQSGLDDWCWAAVALGIGKGFANPAMTNQCTIATNVLNTGQGPAIVCCPPLDQPRRDFCNTTHDLPAALGPHHRGTLEVNARPDRARVKTEIDGGFPIGVRIQFRDANRRGHFIVISGYLGDGPAMKLLVWDPDLLLGRPTPVPFDLAVNRYRGSGEWQQTYLTQGADGTNPRVAAKGGVQ